MDKIIWTDNALQDLIDIDDYRSLKILKNMPN